MVLAKVKSKWLYNQRKLSASAHEVYKCDLNEKGQHKLSVSPSTQVFVKKEKRLERQEEAAFSALYRLDIGESAAKTFIYQHRGHDTGIASIGLNNFVEYWKLHVGYDADAKALANDVFEYDGKQPKKIKYVKGLASILMSSWLYGEDDFHCGNFGLSKNKAGEWIWSRLDFGMSFASITDAKRPIREVNKHFDVLTLKDLQNFPDLQDASLFYWPTRQTSLNYTFNFKGFWNHNAYHSADKALFKALMDDPEFIKEKHQFMLKQFFIDIDHKKTLIKENIDAPYGDRIATSIASRVMQLKWTSLADPEFRKYVCSLSPDSPELQDLISEVAGNVAEVDEEISVTENAKSILEQFQQLQHTVHTVDSAEVSHPAELLEKINQAEKGLLLLKSEHRYLLSLPERDAEETRLKFEAIAKQEAILDELYAEYLAMGRENHQVEQYLSVLHGLLIRRSVLTPIHNLYIYSATDAYPDQLFFKQILDNWIMPNLEAADESFADDLFQKQILIRLRNLEQLFCELSSNEEMQPKLQEIAAEFMSDTATILGEDEAQQKLKDIELKLLKLKYVVRNQYHFPNKLKLYQNVSSDTPITADLGRIFYYASTDLLDEFLVDAYNSQAQYAEVKSAPFLADLKRLDALSSDFFNEQFFEQLSANKLSPQEADMYQIGLARLQGLVKEYHLSADPYAEFKRLPLKKQQAFIQDLSFILSRLALDMQRVRARTNLSSIADPALRALTEQLIDANQQISWAMAKPSYHDRATIGEVAQAGLLAATALSNPTVENASNCLAQVEKLSNSHQTRRATVVATAVAVIAGLTLGLSMLALLGPFSIPVLAAFSVPVLASMAAGSGVTFFASAGYALKRAIKDRDKVERYMKDFSNKVQDVAEYEPEEPSTPKGSDKASLLMDATCLRTLKFAL
jgi:hypothetical protein